MAVWPVQTRGERLVSNGRPHRPRRPRISPKRRWLPGMPTSIRRRRSAMSPDAARRAAAPAVEDARHTHGSALAHHFDTLEQQREASTLGMWVFLSTEVLFFGVLFAVYSLYRAWYSQ